MRLSVAWCKEVSADMVEGVKEKRKEKKKKVRPVRPFFRPGYLFLRCARKSARFSNFWIQCKYSCCCEAPLWTWGGCHSLPVVRNQLQHTEKLGGRHICRTPAVLYLHILLWIAFSICEALVNTLSPGKQQLMASWWHRSHGSRCGTRATGSASLCRARCDGRGSEGGSLADLATSICLRSWQELGTPHGAHPLQKGRSKLSF